MTFKYKFSSFFVYVLQCFSICHHLVNLFTTVFIMTGNSLNFNFIRLQ